MKYCTHCGAELCDEAVVCVKCGCKVDTERPQQQQDNVLATVIKVFLILACIGLGFGIIPLAWCIPMTRAIFKKLDARQPIGVGLKVCTLIFVNVIAGILLLCMNDYDQQI